jgi:hypothetical protein
VVGVSGDAEVVVPAAPAPGAGAQGAGAPGTGASGAGAQGTGAPGAGAPPDAVSTDPLEVRFKKLERELETLRPTAPVEEALRHVRTLAACPSLTASHVLIAAVELLVDLAIKHSHKDTDLFSRALQAARGVHDVFDLCALCLKVFGSAHDKTISKALSEIAKDKRYARPYGSGGRGHTPYNSQASFSGQGRFGASFQRGRGGFRTPFRVPQWRRDSIVCYSCKATGHIAAECSSAQK